MFSFICLSALAVASGETYPGDESNDAISLIQLRSVYQREHHAANTTLATDQASNTVGQPHGFMHRGEFRMTIEGAEPDPQWEGLKMRGDGSTRVEQFAAGKFAPLVTAEGVGNRWSTGWRDGFPCADKNMVKNNFRMTVPSFLGFDGLPIEDGYTATKEECAYGCTQSGSTVAPHMATNSAIWATQETVDYYTSGRYKSNPQAKDIEDSAKVGGIEGYYRKNGKGYCQCAACYDPAGPTLFNPMTATDYEGFVTLGPPFLYAYGIQARRADQVRGVGTAFTGHWPCRYDNWDEVCGYNPKDADGNCIIEETDEASATGDPHLVTSSGGRYDLQMQAEH